MRKIMEAMFPTALVILFLAALAFILFVAGPAIDRADEAARQAAAAARALDPPDVEVLLLTDGQAKFPVYAIHDRQTGCAWLAIGKPGRQTVVPRTTQGGQSHCGWTLGEPKP